MKFHPAIPEGYGELSVDHKLRVAGIIAGREFLNAFLEYLESGVRILGSSEDKDRLYEKREARELRIQSSVDEYLDNRELLPSRPL